MDYTKDYYKELNLDKGTSIDDIKKQYRKLALKYHPDKNQGDKISAEKFTRINEANSVLSNEKTKQEYDTKSPNGNNYSPFNGFGGFGGVEFDFGGVGDIFNSFFGKGFNPFNQREEFREQLDINTISTITLKDIYLNKELIIKFKKYIHCDDCNGTGFDKTSHSDICEICNGSGINNGRQCEYCHGEGKIYTGQCKKCSGEKVILSDAEVNLQNISQIRSNVRNAYRSHGHQSKYYRDKVGSLLLNINVNREDDYKIVNNVDLQKTIDVHYTDAIEGNEYLYNHVDGSVMKIKIPKKSNNGNFIRIKEQGLLKNEGKRGDLYLQINISIDYDRV